MRPDITVGDLYDRTTIDGNLICTVLRPIQHTNGTRAN
jgi:hypothetical protein